jgi:hypothetical protein
MYKTIYVVFYVYLHIYMSSALLARPICQRIARIRSSGRKFKVYSTSMTHPIQQPSSHTNPLALDIFLSLEGKWKLQRSLDSRLASSPSGTVEGIVDFTKLNADDLVSDFLYTETGKFSSRHGVFDVSNRYVYAYNDAEKRIDIYFVSETGKSRGKPFIPLNLAQAVDEFSYCATSDHLCVKDMYTANYSFTLDESRSVDSMEIIFNVVGPSKDYQSKTIITRI